MNILVTGGAGFIGSHTVDAALAAGHSVRVLDDLSTGTAANLPDSAELLTGDVTDLAAVEQALQGCDAVIHLAALVSVPQSLQEPANTYHVNTTGTVGLLEAARQAGVRRAVLASTCAVYGDLPGRKSEDSLVQPLVPYAASKRMAEQWLQLYAVAYGMETVVLRYFNVYGPRQRADSPYSGVIARWCDAAIAGERCRIFGDGNQTRDFISVHDVAQANLLAATLDTFAWGEIYQVATGQSMTLNGVLDALASVSPQPLQRSYEAPRTGDIVHSSGSSDKLQRLGWRPTVPLADGLAELVRPAAS
ncbi:MAG: NAD-dependent epimerase/dehydratase family protein [Caldilineaceae bacterium]|nr:NAD-dependent epimerase/dehydratase family protein [Caldilineaceae bacterium]MCB9120656.1 NAD-dependent epimerase/dehydratase family protein [Caldilineaceae bacterium]MCB9123989.1 NAD-dependent epimerase/dehydratase family protein [Caldilineaceae bacterium]